MDAGVVHLTGLWRQLARPGRAAWRRSGPAAAASAAAGSSAGTHRVTGGHMGSLRVRSQQDGAAEFTRAASDRICRFDRGRRATDD